MLFRSIDRYKQRSTELHSTITIDNQNSSKVWSGFRVANRAKVFDIKNLKKGFCIVVTGVCLTIQSKL